MKSNYEQWWERESQWSIELNAKSRKKGIIMTALSLPGGVLVSLGIGLYVGGIAGAINNLLPGFILGIVSVLIASIMFLPVNHSKRYLKLLQKEMERVLQSSGEREEFVTQMLGKDGANTVKCLEFANHNKAPSRIWISRDYVLKTSVAVSSAHIVRLKDTDRIETDLSTGTIRIGRVRTNYENYEIYFYYNKVNQNNKKDTCDETFSFSDIQTRDQVIKAIREMTSN